MNKYVSLDKRSKKAQREYHAKQRCTWGELNPVTRSVPSGKTYNRKKEKQRIGNEFRNGFDADLFFSLYLLHLVPVTVNADNYICQGVVVLGYIDGQQPVSKPRKPGRVQIIE